LSAETAAGGIGRPERLRIITGHFDPVHAEHARHLRALRDGSCTVVVLTDSDAPISPQRARAEVLAGLGSVDFVVTMNGASVDALLLQFPAAEVIRDEKADAARTRKLMEHVHRKQEMT
jgi:bifunctional ADP-heptose synthase (sugar kinase/adenylyltransferase)